MCEKIPKNRSMSSGLMSCVRENSPPLELNVNASPTASGPLSLPETTTNNSISIVGSGRDVGMTGSTSMPLAATSNNNDNGIVSSSSSASTSQQQQQPNVEQQKRRRFHPLRNLRRIFRRRTITNATADSSGQQPQQQQQQQQQTTNNSSNSEKNLRSATLNSISSTVSASSPSSPLTHQQLQEAYSSQSLPKSKSYSSVSANKLHKDVLLSVTGNTNNNNNNKKQQKQQQKLQLQQQQLQPQQHQQRDNDMYTTTATTTSTSYHSSHQQQQQQYRQTIGGVAVLPNAMPRNFFTERQKLRSIGGDSSSQDLDSSGNDSGTGATISATTITNTTMSHSISGSGSRSGANGGNISGGEMTDSQRSLSEGRLVDSDYSNDPLSQSHDSVFSESATASSLSIVLKAELADVLRKRRNRPDVSDEDLGLPRSPSSPQRRIIGTTRTTPTSGDTKNHNATNNSSIGCSVGVVGGNQSEASSLSLLSMNSTDAEDVLAASTANNSLDMNMMTVKERNKGTSRFTYLSKSMSTDGIQQRHSTGGSLADAMMRDSDEVDLFSNDWPRLSHAAAKHKMAVRPVKKKGPSRQHRRTLETSIPEANEDNMKLGANFLLDAVDCDAKAKSRSLPPGVNAKILEQHTAEMKKTSTASSTTTTSPTKTNTTTTTATKTSLITSPATKSNTPNTAVTTKLITNSDSITIANSATIGTMASTVTATSTTTTATSNTGNIFGFRALSTKATSIFETRDHSPVASGSDTSESGFLRRLITRNSKRSIAKANAGDDDADADCHQSEPKKLNHDNQLDLSSEPKRRYESNADGGKSGLSAMLNSFMAHEQRNSGTIQQQKHQSHFNSQPPKPKSGPAARQRYLPQDLSTGNTLDRNLNLSPSAVTLTPMNTQTSKGETNQQDYHEETLKSTSILREINAAATAAPPTAKIEHHYEKKAKIVGLSAFQQKISRSSDSFARNSSNNTSTNSLESSNDEAYINLYPTFNGEKQRKTVEKSRSFRTYTEERQQQQQQQQSYSKTMTTTTIMQNALPSLPDLSVNLRVPQYYQREFIVSEKEYSSPSPPDPEHDKSVSLGFEINDNNLMKPASGCYARSMGNLYTTVGSNTGNESGNTSLKSGNKLLTPSNVVPNLSPTNSCNRNISEIEENIDMIVKSPFVSVLRKSALYNDEVVVVPTASTPPTPPTSPGTTGASKQQPAFSAASTASTPHQNRASTTSSVDNNSRLRSPIEMPDVHVPLNRPTVLNLKEKTTTVSHEEKTSNVPMREKFQRSSIVGSVRATIEETEKKSTPAVHNYQARRSISVTDSTPMTPTTPITPITPITPNTTNTSNTPITSSNDALANAGHSSADETGVPEFMKIQLNRVDPGRISKSGNVVLAKNVKEASQGDRHSVSTDDLSFIRRFSNESVEITEHEINEQDVSNSTDDRRASEIFEAINKQTKAKSLSSNSVRSSGDFINNYTSPVVSTPKSPIKKTFGSQTSTTTVATTPSISIYSGVSSSVADDTVLLREKSMKPPSVSPKLSLQERRKLFMSEDKTKVDRKIEEIRNERKKSINEEFYRKSIVKMEEKFESTSTITSFVHSKPTAIATPSPTEKSQDPIPDANGVVLRKKSFGYSNNNANNVNSINNVNKDDSTPELMKVFARRSLKIKDEDLGMFTEKSSPISASTKKQSTISTSSIIPTASQPSVDSDKENQSSSEEKLDKLPKFEVAIEQQQQKTIGNVVANNRNSLIEVRQNAGNIKNGGNLLMQNNNHIHSNNNANNQNNNISNNNNHNNNNSQGTSSNAPESTLTITTTTTISSSHAKNFLPPIKVNAFRSLNKNTNGSNISKVHNSKVMISNNVASTNGERKHLSSNSNNTNEILYNNNNNNSNNINNNNNNNGLISPKPHLLDRQSFNAGSNAHVANSSGSITIHNKTIERSATVGEFKGIHQRRAEWEQRAKEALK